MNKIKQSNKVNFFQGFLDRKPYRLFYILLAGIVGVLLNACATSHRDKIAEEMEESAVVGKKLEAQFTADLLTEEKLEAFEVRAQQKLQDFADYLNMIMDPTLDSVFRQQAIWQALDLFSSDSVTIAMDTQKETIEDFLLHIRQDSNKREKYDIQEIKVVQPLQAAGQQYTGTLSFRSVWMEEAFPPATAKKVHFLVKKVEKQFGYEKKLIWEVFLGEIG